MVKFLFSVSRTLLFSATLVMAGFLSNELYAQCGLSNFNQGGTQTPTGAWQNVPGGVGSDTYVNFNVTAGNIYSFRYTGSTVLGYNLDMTLSSTSAILPYNVSATPINDSWSGGIACPAGPRPTSAEWFSTFTGTLRVNTHLWNGACQNWVSGAGSTTLQYKVCTPSPDPGTGTNQWIVDAFATTDITIPNLNARYGYYVDGALNFNTTASWGALGRPSDAASWVGCEVPNDNFIIRARRTGFPCGYYNINVNNSDDDIRIFVNGTQIFNAGCCIGSTTLASPYVLGPTDNVEIRLRAVCGSDQANVSFVPQAVPPLAGGTIGGVANNTNICQGPISLTFTNAGSPSGGVTGFINGGTVTYDWEVSTDGGTTFNPQGVGTPNWVLNDTLPAGGVFVIRRKATDRCGNTAYSNSITVIGQPQPNASMVPSNTTICPGATAVLTLNFNTGTPPFNITYTDGVSNFTRTGKVTGDTIHVTPAISTIYSFVSISDFYGCVRTSGFTGGALVQIQPSITIVSVNTSQPSCFGGGNGTITINATGGVSPLSYSINGGTTTQFSNTFTVSAGNYNIAVVDGFGCTQTFPGNPVVIGQPTAVAHTTSTTDASCANVFDGTITVTASGGTPPYTYNLNGGPSQPSNVFNGLGAASYTVSVFDANGCVDTSNAVINNTYIISVDTVSQTNVSCFGLADGAVTVQVTGGIPPYSYSINGITFQSSGTFTGLNAGSYVVVGRDSKGCTEFANVTITQPSQVSISIDSISNLLCYGSATGGIYITPSGGTPGYTFSWTGGTNTEDITNVASGTYNVTVTDSKGCTATNGATISQPLELFLNIAIYSDPLCFGDSTGTIDVTANGGVPPYTYAWSNGSASEDLSHLPGGVYTVTVNDANGCQKTLSQTLTQPTPLVSSITGTNVTCYGFANGAADLTVSGGTSPYFFLWSANFQTSEDVSGLSGGLHSVIITDNNGCQQRDSIFITEPQQLLLNTNVTVVSCFNSTDGAIDLTVTGGTTPYTYQWNNNATTKDLSNLGGGTYCVSVTDANGCSATSCSVISNPSIVSSNFIVKSVLCYGDANGVVDLIPSGGTPPYTYGWSNAATTEDLLGVPAGTYYVTITDSKGCTRIDSATVIQPEPLVTSGFIKNVTCYGDCDGAIDITAYGGTLPYAFAWSTSESTEDIIALCGANYYVTVTDGNGCVAATLYPVLEPPVLGLTLAATNVSCYGGTDGNVAAIPFGGRTPYEYLWNNFSLDSFQVGIPAGTYTVILTDSSGCHISSSIAVTQPTEITITGIVTDVACNGAATGAIDISVTGGVSPYTFSWSNSASTEDLAGLIAGTYTVSVTDANNCLKTATFTVTQAVALFTNVSLSNPVCYGGSNGFISVDVTGGTIPYSYSWNTTPVQTGATATNLKAGTYLLTVTDNGNCSATVSATLTEPAQIEITANGIEAKCYNTPTGSVTATVTGGNPPYVYTLNGVTQQSDSFGNLSPGTYVISVRDVNGCEGTETFVITSPSAVMVDLTAPQSVILAGMTTQLLTNVNSSSPVINYLWQPLDSVIYDFSHCNDPFNCFNPYVQPLYTTVFTVTVMNQDSCYASDTVTIIVENELAAFIPTAFTPNNDNLNDLFTFDILGATAIEVSVFNRWGELMFYNANQTNGTDATDGWNGTKDGKALPNDTYVYQMKITYFDGVVREKSGTITMMR
ncbi:MAG: gliding motility-associated C-terminal domain-containing protein [Chitinophagales bacterium]|nr:gliding motility-associated C-terminal domain-containing protein [Chitinophagales bacterium]